ncbi:MAG: UDP-N-acetylmuramate dehydrogenase [Candidatus Magasanikbacteria bacterium]|nr:UDP-N-acetylmuramate dehydrogenase [Candidatus Magasanikbacteria bacterium]
MDSLYKELQQFGDVSLRKFLAKFTTFKIGGPADRYVEVTDTKKFTDLLNFLSGRGVDYFLLGGGSNVLLPDNGLRGVVIRVKTNKMTVDGNMIMAEAGVSFGAVVTKAVQQSLTGLEWATGLPGTVGGAVRGNAGAVGGDIAHSVSKIKIWQDSEIVELTPDDCAFGYRDSMFKRSTTVVLAAWFTLSPGNPRESLAVMQEILKKRAGHYPSYPSAGSFFKNIPLKDWPHPTSELPAAFVEAGRVPAGWITEQAGLKGLAVGGAMVSREHGNFLINHKDATQADVLALVEEIKAKVYNTSGVELEEEVQIVK